MKIVDSQVHLIPRDTPDRRWAHVRGEFHGFSEFTEQQLLDAMDSAGVDRAVVVPTYAVDGHRNDVVLSAAARHPDRLAAVGRIELTDPSQSAVLDRWRTTPGLLGLRVTFQAGASAKWIDDGTAEWFWPAAEAAGVPVYIHAPGLLSRIPPIATRHPRLRLAIDHMGIPGTAKPHELRPITDEVVGLARFPNVSVKLSGLPSVAGDAYPYFNVHELVKRAIDAFGPDRAFWGSDLTRLPCTYRESVEMFTEHMGLADTELELVMGRALETWLGWA